MADTLAKPVEEYPGDVYWYDLPDDDADPENDADPVDGAEVLDEKGR